MKWINRFRKKALKIQRKFYKQILFLELLVIQLIGSPAYAVAFTPPQKFLDGVQWVVLGSQFLTVCIGVWQLGPIAWALMRKNQQKVEEGKEHAVHVAIGLAVVFLGTWALKTYIESIGGTYPLSF